MAQQLKNPDRLSSIGGRVERALHIVRPHSCQATEPKRNSSCINQEEFISWLRVGSHAFGPAVINRSALFSTDVQTYPL